MMTRASLRLAAVHFAANLVLLAGGYFWLGIGLSRGVELLYNALFGLLLVALAAWTYGAAFAFFDSTERKLIRPAWKLALRHLLPLIVAMLGIVVVYWLLALWQDYSSNPAFTIASSLTLMFRKPVKPASIQTVLDDLLAVVRWAVVPVLLLPMFAAISTHGWPGFKSAGSMLKRWWFWLAAPALLLLAMELPLVILDWRPHVENFALETLSFAARGLLAYLLFVAGWLTLAFATSAGKPRPTQPSTVASP
jgi:hypothetical protein